MSKEAEAEVAAYWWRMAEEALQSARREEEAGAFVFAVNRMYYAAFYAVTAVLPRRGFRFRKHSGLRASFHREIVKPGIVEREWGQLFDRLLDSRQEGDYLALVEFEPEFVREQLTRATQLLARLRQIAPAVGGQPQAPPNSNR